jgi:hypothetical protein
LKKLKEKNEEKTKKVKDVKEIDEPLILEPIPEPKPLPKAEPIKEIEVSRFKTYPPSFPNPKEVKKKEEPKEYKTSKSANLNLIKFLYAQLTGKTTTNLKKAYMKEVVVGILKQV